MNSEKRKVLDRINNLIDVRKNELLTLLPDIYEIVDGVIKIRSFSGWSNHNENINEHQLNHNELKINT